ncbi:hypothetical protein [Rubinisphaera margarita]|uniref:hypothetical protein n=1 Tax=Rubinisphaera margarita TaxID=2909586 RepID=UPI001EE781D9|nr:hypothetical protein [Rubinisphaera margarita]MCG6157104.1 hypothetical protein [Rubinisphaera margarita]
MAKRRNSSDFMILRIITACFLPLGCLNVAGGLLLFAMASAEDNQLYAASGAGSVATGVGMLLIRGFAQVLFQIEANTRYRP